MGTQMHVGTPVAGQGREAVGTPRRGCALPSPDLGDSGLWTVRP